MRTYLILKEKAEQWNADDEIQGLLEEINADDDSTDEFSRKLAGLAKEWEDSGLAERKVREGHSSETQTEV